MAETKKRTTRRKSQPTTRKTEPGSVKVINVRTGLEYQTPTGSPLHRRAVTPADEVVQLLGASDAPQELADVDTGVLQPTAKVVDTARAEKAAGL